MHVTELSRGARSALSALLGLIACVAMTTACTERQSEVVLEPTDLSELASGESHTYEVTTKTGQYVFGSVNQNSVDIVVTINGPDGEQIGAIDVSARGPEHVHFETTMAGIHQIIISPFEEAEGEYSVGAFRQERLADTVEGKVDQMMSRYSDDMPGGVIAVVRSGKIVFSRSYGLANVEYAVPNSISTPYHMASVSKQFTAMAIIMLDQRGLLGLDDDVRKHLPDLPDFGPTITLRHLLNHTSGLRDHWALWVMSGGMMDDVIRQQDLVRLVHRQKDLNFEPGAEYLYSNTGFMLLSEVVTTVSGKPFGEWMTDNVFEPLGMSSTQIYDDHERIVPGRAYSYHLSEDGLSKSVLSFANSGATSLFTTAEDLAKWLANFNSGLVGGTEAIEMLQVQGVLNDGETIDYALGIGVSEQNGLRRLSHGGSDAGFRTWLGYYPEIDAGIIVLGNDASFGTNGVGPAIANAFFSNHMIFENNAIAEPDSDSSNNTQTEEWQPDAIELTAYTGRYYSDELETFYSLSLEGDQLKINHVRHGDFTLSPQEKGAFGSGVWFIGTVKFDSAEEDGVSAMRMTNGGVRNLVFERVD